MQISLFANNRIINSYSRDLHHLSTKPVSIGMVFGQNMVEYKKEKESDSNDIRFHKERCVEAFDVTDKTYNRFCGVLYDFHHELAKLNILLGYGPYVTLISLEDSLDYVLHTLCGCNMASIRNITRYTELSRALLKLNFGEFLNRFSIRDLVGIDEKLDKFLASVELEVSEGRDLNEEMTEEELETHQTNFLSNFITKLITRVDDINKYLGYNYKLVRGDSGTVKSKSACSFLLASKERFEHELLIKYDNCEDYTLFVRSFERWEYSSKIELPYAKWEAANDELVRS